MRSNRYCWVLATVTSRFQWYRLVQADGQIDVGLHDELDLDVVTTFAHKDAAKAMAIAAGLKSWRYVRF
ncbi:hypothetical protein [Pigmentiphaga sp.]|uniref:hypothetical protein n=1 Tax=Pigmentiphaga sp. TaxID=1977564 RepID=UPI0025CF2680|nr:hypothetical protein [Pigmentiphaga sp.]